MRKYLVGAVMAGLCGFAQVALAAGSGSGYLGLWLVSSYVDANGKTHGMLSVSIDATKTTFVDKFGNVQNYATLNDASCGSGGVSGYIDLSDPANDSVKREWYSLVLIAETMKRPITIVTGGCVAISATSGATYPKVTKILLR